MLQEYSIQLCTVTGDTMLSFGTDRSKAMTSFRNLVSLFEKGLLPGASKIEISVASVKDGEVVSEEVLNYWPDIRIRYIGIYKGGKRYFRARFYFLVNSQPGKIEVGDIRRN